MALASVLVSAWSFIVCTQQLYHITKSYQLYMVKLLETILLRFGDIDLIFITMSIVDLYSCKKDRFYFGDLNFILLKVTAGLKASYWDFWRWGFQFYLNVYVSNKSHFLYRTDQKIKFYIYKDGFDRNCIINISYY